jgi:hypothetical protein
VGDRQDLRDGVGGGAEEGGFLPDGVDEEHLRPESDRERDAREPAAGAQVEDALDPARAEQRDGAEAVHDMKPRDLRGIADRGEVDRLVPPEEQLDVAVHGAALVRREVDPELCEPGVEGLRKRGRQRRKVLNARRERISLAAQVPLLWMYPLPPGRAAPGVVCCAPRVRVGLPRLVRFVAGFPRAPREPGYPPPGQPQCGCRTLGSVAGAVNAVIHQSTPRPEVCG